MPITFPEPQAVIQVAFLYRVGGTRDQDQRPRRPVGGEDRQAYGRDREYGHAGSGWVVTVTMWLIAAVVALFTWMRLT